MPINTSRLWPVIFPGVSVAVAMVALVLSGRLTYGYLALRHDRLALQEHPSGRPMPINGLQLHLADTIIPVPSSQQLCTILILSSDLCQFCHDEVRVWERLISQLPVRQDVRVTLLTKDSVSIPTRLGDALKARGIPHEIARVIDRHRFIEETGLTTTPGLLLLDAESRIRLVAVRTTPIVEREIVELLNNPPCNSKGGQ
jgi:hypothetical protein